MMRKLVKIPKRLLVQIVFFFLQNPFLGNFVSGTIYQGGLKRICTPGLNCYSCPAAVASCPIGALQHFFAGARYNISLFVTGFLMTIGIIFGRFICGYVCPMGLLQDLLYKIKTPKIKARLRYARYIKYAVLILFVILLPMLIRHELTGLGDPWFCKYVCPSGTIFGAFPLMAANSFLRDMIGLLFIFKAVSAIALIVVSMFIFRIFCRVLCPLGAIYSLFNKIAFIRMHYHNENCTSCKKCSKACNIHIDPPKTPNSPECIRCGDCIKACADNALGYNKQTK